MDLRPASFSSESFSPEDLLEAAPPFEATFAVTDREAIVSVAGEIDLATCGQLARIVEQAIAVRSRIVFDLAETTFIDSSGLAVILRAQRAMGQIPEAVVVRSASRRVRTLFELTGCDRLVTFD